MKLENLINNKLRDVKLNNSNGNYRFYLSHTSHFLTWCSNRNIELVSQVNEDTLVEYISDMKSTCSNSTINKRIGILKRVWIFNNLKFDYLLELKKLKERYITYSNIDDSTFKKIREYIISYPELKENDLMHKTLLALLVDTGARIDEILNIEKKNINLKEQTILLEKTKTGVDRVVYITKTYIKIIESMIKKNTYSSRLLYNFEKKRDCIYEDARYLMRKIKEQFNLNKLHTHMFRHTIATHLIENNVSVFSVMALLGHTNIKTTQRYTHLSNKHVKSAYSNVMDQLD